MRKKYKQIKYGLKTEITRVVLDCAKKLDLVNLKKNGRFSLKNEKSECVGNLSFGKI